ncbi:MAG: hypothetical protein H0T76_06650 [Nannocystis sp.]|nr:hypothetical protein [Nannocystis sp.]MBA3546141.1 hypothetical protein [Nannocystis sp.]
MRTATTKFTALLIAGLIAPTVALAAPKFQNGVTITDTGTALVVTGTIIGVGNETVTVDLDADATVETICLNPKGKDVPGQTKMTTVDAEADISPTKNGKIIINVATAAVTPGTCPNVQWEPIVGDVTFANVTLTIEQGGVTLFECGGDAPACVIN